MSGSALSLDGRVIAVLRASRRDVPNDPISDGGDTQERDSDSCPVCFERFGPRLQCRLHVSVSDSHAGGAGAGLAASASRHSASSAARATRTERADHTATHAAVGTAVGA